MKQEQHSCSYWVLWFIKARKWDRHGIPVRTESHAFLSWCTNAHTREGTSSDEGLQAHVPSACRGGHTLRFKLRYSAAIISLPDPLRCVCSCVRACVYVYVRMYVCFCVYAWQIKETREWGIRIPIQGLSACTLTSIGHFKPPWSSKNAFKFFCSRFWSSSLSEELKLSTLLSCKGKRLKDDWHFALFAI